VHNGHIVHKMVVCVLENIARVVGVYPLELGHGNFNAVYARIYFATFLKE